MNLQIRGFMYILSQRQVKGLEIFKAKEGERAVLLIVRLPSTPVVMAACMIDQELALDPLSDPTVTAIAKESDFSTRFGEAMITLGAVQVLTGKTGEIRRFCNTTKSSK